MRDRTVAVAALAPGRWATRPRRGRGDRGSVSVEFAVALPVVVVVIGLAVGVVAAAGVQMRLQVAASAVARALGRDDPAAARVAVRLAPGARTTVSRSGDVVCVVASRPVRIGVLPAVDVSATGCALTGGR